LFSGYVTDNLNWRLIFLPNLLFVSVAIWLLRRHYPNVPRSGDTRTQGVDRGGIALLAISLICLQVILSRGEVDDWFGAPHLQMLAWVGAISFFLFICWQTHSSNRVRLLRLELVRDRNVLASIFLGVFAGIILSGSIYALPEFLRHVDPREMNATDAGRIMCTYALTAAAIRPAVTWVIGKLGQRKVLSFALVMLIISMLLMSNLMTSETPEILFVIPLALYAFCLAPLLSSIAGGTVARLPQETQLDAVSIYMTFRQFGAALGVTLVTIVLDRREELHSSRLFEHLRQSAPAATQWLDEAAKIAMSRGGYSSLQAKIAATKILGEAGARQAATLAYADAFLFMAAVGVAALCFVPLMSPTPMVKK
jgi:MFS transporter, DHA2 family, multidrug resistance protein